MTGVQTCALPISAHRFVSLLTGMYNGLARFLECSWYGCYYHPHGPISKCNGIHKGMRMPAAFNLNTHTRTYTHLAVRSITGSLHQLYSVLGTRLDTTFEWLGVPVTSQSKSAAVWIDSYKKTHRMKAPSNSTSGIRGLPSSSKTGPISNTDSTQTTVRYTVRRAKDLPGQILPGST